MPSEFASQTRSAYVPCSLAMTKPVTVSLKVISPGFSASLPRTTTEPSTSAPSTAIPSDAAAVSSRPDSPAGSGPQVPGTPQMVCSESIHWVLTSARLPFGCTTESSRRSW